MATTTVRDRVSQQQANVVSRGPSNRRLALAGLGLTTVAFMSVLYRIAFETGGAFRLSLHAVIALGLAWYVADRYEPRTAAITFVVLALVSYAWYFLVVIEDLWLLVEAPLLIAMHTVDDIMSIATGQSVLAIAATDAWAYAFAPGPLFLTWYFAIRRRYTVAAGIAGATMLLFVFSGDLGTWWTLVGALGVVLAIGFGTIEVTDAPASYREWVVILVAAMAVVGVLVPLVPSGGALGPLSIIDSDDEIPTLEDTLVGSGGDSLEIIGEIETSPEVRYLLDSDDQSTYVRTTVYDHYTGSGWERTGGAEPFSVLDREERESATERVEQWVTPLVESDQLPAAGQVLNVMEIAHSRLERTAQGTITVEDGLEVNESAGIISFVPERPSGPTTSGDVDDQYLQLPESVPEELHEFTEALVGDLDDPHAKAERIVSYLRSSKSYTHDVTVPSGDVAAGFLFDRDAGYCTYFATTAVVMLRSADVPARLAVGYTTGQQLDDRTSVIRGMNSHAWPEVHIEGHGWVSYEPTPGSDWENFRSDLLEEAREDGIDGIDIGDSEALPYDHTPTPPEEEGASNDSDGTGPDNTTPTDPDGDPGSDDDFQLPTDPSEGHAALDPPPEVAEDIERGPEDFPDLSEFREQTEPAEEDTGLLLGLEWQQLVLTAGLMGGAIAGAIRVQLPRRLRHQLRLRYQRGSQAPEEDLELAAERLEWAMEQRFRPRRPGETLRDYYRYYRVVNDDPSVKPLFDAIERARYAGEVDEELATAAVEHATALVDDTVVLGGRLLPAPMNARRNRR